MDSEYESSRIEKKKRGLYDPEFDASQRARESELSSTNIDVANNWEDTTIVHEHEKPDRAYGVKALKALVVLAVIATFASGGFLLYQLFDPLAKPSDKNILIAIEVPTSVSPGTPEDITVRVSNQNRVALEYANLTVIFPSGTRDGDNPSKDLRDEKKLFGTIEPGQVMEFQTKAIFLGQENTDKELRASLEFRFANINSVFTKVSDPLPIHMLSSPVNLVVDALKEVNAGQIVEMNIRATSNTLIPLRDVLVKVDFPLGFSFIDADPKPTFGNNIWRIGTLDPTQKFVIKLHGTLSGNDSEEKVIYTSVGAGTDQTSRDINAEYSKVLSSMVLKRPFIGVSLNLNDKLAQSATVHFGERVNGSITWSNNLPTKIINAKIDITLSGVALDRTSVSAGKSGYFDSTSNTITWDYRGDPALAVLETGNSGSESFSFLPLSVSANGEVLTNPTITAEVTVRGQRISESGVPEEISQFMRQDVKVTSRAQFAARAVYYGSHIINTGPLPPQVEKETTYTVIWGIVNTSNTITNTQVHAILPPGVEWTGTVYPGNENITYNPGTNDITWNPGDISSGTGIGNKAPKEVEFQIVLKPSITQVKQVLPLVTNTIFTGLDTFTGEHISQQVGDLNTLLSTDPLAPQGSNMVAP